MRFLNMRLSIGIFTICFIFSISLMCGCSGGTSKTSDSEEREFRIKYDSVSDAYNVKDAGFSFIRPSGGWIFSSQEQLPEDILICAVDTVNQQLLLLINPQIPSGGKKKVSEYSDNELRQILERIYLNPEVNNQKCRRLSIEPVSINESYGWDMETEVLVDSVKAYYRAVLFDAKDGVYGLATCSPTPDQKLSKDSLIKLLKFEK